MSTVNYLRVVGCEHAAANGAERKIKIQDRLPKYHLQKKLKAYLYKI